jgi:general secretion pathway protein A
LGKVMARKAFLPFHSAAATKTPKNTAAGRHGLVSFRPVATALAPLSSRNGKESGEAEFQLRLFDLTQDPFSDAPDDGFFYTNAAIRQVYRELINALAERPGIAALTGEAGTGKTILLRRLCSELRASGHLVIGHCRAGLVFEELLAVIAEELKIPRRGDEDRGAWPRRFRAALERSKGARPPVLLIDDAERLGSDVVANLGQLLAGPADCSLRILLCGRPELATRLELPGLAELRRMISVVCRLQRISDEDSASYIFHRLRRAGHRGTTLFSAAAINTVVAKAAGLPRRINRVCARSLIVAAAAGRPVITSEVVEEAATELMPKDASPVEAEHDHASARRYRAAIAGSMGASIVAAGIVLYALMGREQAPELVGIVNALHAMTPSREGAAVTRQAVAIPPEGDGVLPERPSGSSELIRLRLEEAPQLKQAVQWAFGESGELPAETSPQPAALEPASPSLLQPADPCREGQEICSNSPDSADHGNTADGGPIMPPSERPGENRGEANSVAGTEPMAQAEQRSPVPALISRAQSQLEAGHIADPTGDNAVETYRQLFIMSPEVAQASELLLEQIRLALWASARNALRAGKWDEARRFYELAVHPAIDIEDAEPLAKPATHDIDTDVPAAVEPVLSRDAVEGARASGSAAPSVPPEMGKTESLDQPEPGQALEAKEAVDGDPRSATPPQASEDVAPAPATGTAEPAQAADTRGPVGASAMAKMRNEGSLAPIAAGSAHSEGAENSGSSTPPEASPQNSVAPAAVPAVMVPAASPLPAETIAVLITRGDELLRIGDISAARLAYERAATGGSARAMTALGMTYDPSFLNRVNARGIRPDPAMAVEWYRKAVALGDAAAAARISQLPALAK